MTAALRPHVVVLAYWLVIVLMAAFFLRQACSLCRANMPTWRRSIVSVLVVTFLAYLIFDYTSYLIMRSLDGVALRVPPWYSYSIWFREPLGLKWLIISQVGPLRYLPFVFAVCGAGILQVCVLEGDVTFGWGLLIVGMQTLATFIGTYIVSLVLTNFLQSSGFTIQGEAVASAANAQPVPADQRASGGRVRDNRTKNKSVAKGQKQKGKSENQPEQEPASSEASEKAPISLELVKKEASQTAESTSEYAKTAAKNLKDYADSFLEQLEDDLAPVTRHLPESVQNFLARGGWWGVLGVCAFIVLLWLRAILHRIGRGFRRKRQPRKKKGRKGSGPNLKEKLGWIGKGFTEEGPEQFTVKGIPARLRLVVLSMANRTSGELSEEMSDRVLDWIKPDSAQIASFDQPAVRVWPPFYSADGFASGLAANVPIPEPPGMQSQWVLVAGRVKMGRVVINVGLAFCASEPNSLRLIKVRGERWLSVLGVTESTSLARSR